MAQQKSGRAKAADLSKIAKERKIKYFLISFVDLYGVLRAKLVPSRAIAAMASRSAIAPASVSFSTPIHSPVAISRST